MIVNGLLTLVYGFLTFMFSAVNLPTFPASFMGYVDSFIVYLESGVQILGNYVDLGYLLLLFEIFIALWLAFELWKFVFWVLRKIPLLGIK